MARERHLRDDPSVAGRNRRRPEQQPAAPVPVERPEKPESITWMFRTWTPWSALHPTYAVGLLYLILGQILHETVGVPFRAFSIPLPLTDAAIPIPWMLIYIPLGLLAGLVATYGDTFRGSTKLYFTSAGLSVTVWFALVQINGVYHAKITMIAAGLWLLFTFTYPNMRRRQAMFEDWWWLSRHPIREAAALVGDNPGPPPLRSYAERWEDTFGHALGWQKDLADAWGRKRGLLTFVERVRTPEPGNYTLHMRLPKSGLPFKKLVSEGAIEAIERQFGVADGSVRIERVGAGERYSSTDILIHFDVVDILSRSIDFDETDDTPVSILKAFRIGRYADGGDIYLTLREVHTLIAGMTGAGKSNLLHIIIWQISRCYDAVIWVMDLKGGAFIRPWMLAWYFGKADRPVIDWVATDLWEAWKMVVSAFAIATWRNQTIIGSKWQVTRKTPALIFISDEFSEAVGMYNKEKGDDDQGRKVSTQKMAELFTRLLVLARSAAIWMLIAGQRTTVDMFGTGTAVAQIKQRIGMQVTAAADAFRVFGFTNFLAAKVLQRLHHAGSFLIQIGSFGKARVSPGKAAWLGEDNEMLVKIWHCSIRRVANDKLGPAPLDPESHAAALLDMPDGHVRERWTDPNRMGWLINAAERAKPQLAALGLDVAGGPTGAGAAPVLVKPRQAMPVAETPLQAYERRRAETRAKRAEEEQKRSKKTDDPEWNELVGELAAEPEFDRDRIERIEENPDWIDEVAAEDLSPQGLAAAGSTREEPEVGDTDKVSRVVKIIDDAGVAGISAGELIDEMVRRGVITKAGRSAYRRFVSTALADGRIEQPAGAGKRYFTPRWVGYGDG